MGKYNFGVKELVLLIGIPLVSFPYVCDLVEYSIRAGENRREMKIVDSEEREIIEKKYWENRRKAIDSKYDRGLNLLLNRFSNF